MSYLLLFRAVDWLGIPVPPGHTNMIQMILTLKIIGLAFERNSVSTKSADADKSGDKEIALTAAERDIQDITIINMFHYCFSYIGLLTGKLHRHWMASGSALIAVPLQVLTTRTKRSTITFTSRSPSTPTAGR